MRSQRVSLVIIANEICKISRFASSRVNKTGLKIYPLYAKDVQTETQKNISS